MTATTSGGSGMGWNEVTANARKTCDERMRSEQVWFLTANVSSPSICVDTLSTCRSSWFTAQRRTGKQQGGGGRQWCEGRAGYDPGWECDAAVPHLIPSAQHHVSSPPQSCTNPPPSCQPQAAPQPLRRQVKRRDCRVSGAQGLHLASSCNTCVASWSRLSMSLWTPF
jgi:hypothetical protein